MIGFVAGTIIGLSGSFLLYPVFVPEYKNTDEAVRKGVDAVETETAKENVAATDKRCEPLIESEETPLPLHPNFYITSKIDGNYYSIYDPRLFNVYIQMAGGEQPVTLMKNVQREALDSESPPIFSTTTKKNIIVLKYIGGDMGFGSERRYYIDNVLIKYVGVSKVFGDSPYLRIENSNESAGCDKKVDNIGYNLIGKCGDPLTAEEGCVGRVMVDGLIFNGKKVVSFDKAVSLNCASFMEYSCAPNVEKEINALGINETLTKVYFSTDYLKGKVFSFDINNKTVQEVEKPKDLIPW